MVYIAQFSSGASFIVLSSLTFVIESLDNLCLYALVIGMISTLTLFFVYESPIFLLRTGNISYFVKTAEYICIKQKEGSKYHEISQVVDPQEITLSIKTVKVVKQAMFYDGHCSCERYFTPSNIFNWFSFGVLWFVITFLFHEVIIKSSGGG